MVDSVFTKIIKREFSADILYEDDICIVIFDIAPLRNGHCLVIPKMQVENFIGLENHVFNHVMNVSKGISKKLHDLLDVKRVIMLIEGFEVPHVHIHLIPSNTPLKLGETNPIQDYKSFMNGTGKLLIHEFRSFEI